MMYCVPNTSVFRRAVMVANWKSNARYPAEKEDTNCAIEDAFYRTQQIGLEGGVHLPAAFSIPSVYEE